MIVGALWALAIEATVAATIFFAITDHRLIFWLVVILLVLGILTLIRRGLR